MGMDLRGSWMTLDRIQIHIELLYSKVSKVLPQCFRKITTLQKCRVLSYAVQANKHGLTGHHRV